MPIEVKRFAEEMESFWNKSKVTRQPQNPLCQNLGKVLCCRDNKIKLCKNAKKKMAYDVMLDDDEGLFFNDVEHI